MKRVVYGDDGEAGRTELRVTGRCGGHESGRRRRRGWERSDGSGTARSEAEPKALRMIEKGRLDMWDGRIHPEEHVGLPASG